MYIGVNLKAGEGAHVYRSLTNIREEIHTVRTRIEEINSEINIRDMLLTLLSGALRERPEDWIPEISELILGAKEGLEKLSELSELLTDLKYELEATKEAMGL